MATSQKTAKQLAVEYLRSDTAHFHTAAEVAKAIARCKWTTHYALHELSNDGKIKGRTFKEKNRTTACYGDFATADDSPIKTVRMVPQVVIRQHDLSEAVALSPTPSYFDKTMPGWLRI